MIRLTTLFVALSLAWPCAASPYTHRYDAEIREASELFMPELPWKLWKAQLLSESMLDPEATSPVGAQGVAQFMPRTWREVSRDLMFPESASPYQAEYAIQAGAYYMMRLRRAWRDELKDLERHKFAAASYNAGLGNVRKAHDLCVVGKTIWLYVADCLAQVTGPANARETTRYIAKILGTWKFQLEAEE